MDYNDLLNSMTPEVVERMREAVELGRWPDGRALTPEQLEHSLQALIAWDAKNLPEGKRVGYIDRSGLSKGASAAGEGGDDEEAGASEEPLRWDSSEARS